MRRVLLALAALAALCSAPALAASSFPPASTVTSTQTGPAAVLTCSGTIASPTDSFTCDVAGTASATISVNGTFNGTVQVQGADGATGVMGGRLLFKTGVGSLGTPWIASSGGAVANEYRIVTGGRQVIISALNWTSGSASVTMTATQAASTVFVNGPVHTAEEEAVRNGRAYVVSTGLVTVAAGNYLNFTLVNPAGSNRNIFIVLRRFAQSTANVLTFQSRSNPGALSGGTAVTPSNRRNDIVNPSAATFSYASQGSALASGTAGATGLIPTNGEDELILISRMLAPGTSLGYAIGGAGGGLAAAANVSVDFAWYEESTN